MLQRKMEDVFGQLFEDPGEVSGEWRIPNFLSLPEEVDKTYSSPEFLFLDSCWSLKIYPNGITHLQSEGWVAIYLLRLNCDSAVTVNASITTRIADKEIKADFGEKTFNKAEGMGFTKLLKRSDLQRGERAASPSDTLIISYTLKSVERKPSESTLCSRLWSMSVRYNSTLTSQKRTDVVLKLKDGEIPAHMVILETSSPVFARMFDVDMQGSQALEVNIEDTTRDVFQVVLTFIYSGDLEGLSCENVCEVYKVAHKYELQELKKSCAKFMKTTLCVDTVSDVIALSDLFQETTLIQMAKDYFAKNKSNIFKSEKWKTFRRENPDAACQVLQCAFPGDV